MARESRIISIRAVKLARVTTCRFTVCDLSRIRDDICTEMVETTLEMASEARMI